MLRPRVVELLPTVVDHSFRSYLKVFVDLLQQFSRSLEVIGGHHLPLEDGQRNVRAGRQVQVGDWWQAHWRRGWGVCLGVTLELHDLHVSHCLQKETKLIQQGSPSHL